MAVDLLPILKKNLNRTILLLHFVDFSNVHNSDRITNATRSNIEHKIVYN